MTGGDQQTRVRLSGAFKELDQEKELGVKRKSFQANAEKNNLTTKTSMKHTFFFTKMGIFLKNERKLMSTGIKCPRN